MAEFHLSPSVSKIWCRSCGLTTTQRSHCSLTPALFLPWQDKMLWKGPVNWLKSEMRTKAFVRHMNKVKLKVSQTSTIQSNKFMNLLHEPSNFTQHQIQFAMLPVYQIYSAYYVLSSAWIKFMCQNKVQSKELKCIKSLDFQMHSSRRPLYHNLRPKEKD